MLAPIWLLDFDGVVNALSRRGGRSYWRDWNSATVEHPDGERTRTGIPVQLPLLWSQTVVDTIAGAVDSGVDVRWLSTWREHTQLLPAVIAGLPELPWLDESILDAVGDGELDPQMKQYSGPWKVQVAKAFMSADAALLWTEDALSVDLLSETWRRSRTAPTMLIRPRSATGLISREVDTIREWIGHHT